MARRSRSSTTANPSIRSKIAQEAADAAVEGFARGPGLQAIVDTAVATTLAKIGIDTTDPVKMRRDMLNLREWSEVRQIIRNRGVGAIVATLVAFIVSAMGIGIGVLLHSWQAVPLAK